MSPACPWTTSERLGSCDVGHRHGTGLPHTCSAPGTALTEPAGNQVGNWGAMESCPPYFTNSGVSHTAGHSYRVSTLPNPWARPRRPTVPGAVFLGDKTLFVQRVESTAPEQIYA